jgi:hypothetical protein
LPLRKHWESLDESPCVPVQENPPQSSYVGSRRSKGAGRGGFFVTNFLNGCDANLTWRQQSQTPVASRLYVPSRRIPLLIIGLSLMLAGCESSGGLLNGGQTTQPEAQLAPAAPQVAQNRVAVAPVIGAPDGVSKQLFQDFSSAIGQKSVTVVAAQDKADYALRGYVVAARDKSGVKVSYIWDVTDPAGRRVNRITGEEVVAAAAGDPWASVTPQVSQTIARKSAESLSTWLGQTARANVASAPVVAGSANASAVAQTSVGSLPATTQPVAPAPGTPAKVSAPVVLTTAIPTLVGAPGDGNSTLASALQAELSKNGVPPAGPGATAYRVEGVVKVGAVADGKQPVQIDWNVKDPAGKRLGTVTQKNEIAAGSLDATWGKTADAAASAAAQGILKLLPKQTASN